MTDREEFEKCFQDCRHLLGKDVNGKYLEMWAVGAWDGWQAACAGGEPETKTLFFNLIRLAPTNAAIKSLVEALDFFWRDHAVEMKDDDWPVLSLLVKDCIKPEDSHYNSEPVVVPTPAAKVPEGWRIHINGEELIIDSPDDNHCIISRIDSAPSHYPVNIFYDFCEALIATPQPEDNNNG